MDPDNRDGPALEAACATRLSSVAARQGDDDLQKGRQLSSTWPYGGIVYALELLGLPAAVFRTDRALLAANGLLRKLIPRVVLEAQGRVALACPGADRLLAEALSDDRTAPIAIRIPGNDRRPPMIAHLLAGENRTPPLDDALVLAFTPFARPTPPDASELGHTLALTACEARVTHGIASGKSIEEIARTWGKSTATVRTQLKAVLAKTGTRRQSDLVALVCGLALTRR